MTAARVLVVQHEADGPPGHVGRWLVEAGCLLDVRRPYTGEALPDDLDPVSRFPIPVLGVYGNHDDGRYLQAANATDLHLASADVGGLRFAGFQGHPRYVRGAGLQFSQAQATRLARRIPAADVLVTGVELAVVLRVVVGCHGDLRRAGVRSALLRGRECR